MFLDVNDSRKIILWIKKHNKIKICSSKDVISLLTVDIFTALFKRECIKYEIDVDNINDSDDIILFINKEPTGNKYVVMESGKKKRNFKIENKNKNIIKETDENIKIEYNDILNSSSNNEYKLESLQSSINDTLMSSIKVENTQESILEEQEYKKPETDYNFSNENEENSLLNDKNKLIIKNNLYCGCTEYNQLFSMYFILKGINFFTTKTLWPFIIFYDKKILCDDCKYILAEITDEIKRREEYFGLRMEDRVDMMYLYNSTLYNSLSADIEFLVKRKLFNYTLENQENKIYEYLARIGISRRNAEEEYSRLNMDSKGIVEDIFFKKERIIKKINYDCSITGIEAYFLLEYLLAYNNFCEALIAVQRIEKESLIKCRDFYFKIINFVKINIKKIKNVKDHRILIIKDMNRFKNCNINVLFSIFYNVFSDIFSYMKKEKVFIIILDLFSDNLSLFYSKDRSLRKIASKYEQLREDPFSFIVPKSEFKTVLRKILS